MKSNTEVLIIGAGLAGLSAAYHLGERRNFRIVERNRFVGGTATTERQNGCLFDKTGHLLHLRDPEIKKWVLKMMTGKLSLISRRSLIWSNGVYTDYPFQSNTFGLPPDVAKECLMGYLDTLLKPTVAPVRTFEDFIFRHYGKGFAKHFLIPYNKKIWGVHPREMSVAWCNRFVPVPNLESVIAGALGSSDRQSLGYNAKFYYPTYGIGELSKIMAEKINRYQNIELGIGATSVNASDHIVKLSTGEVVSFHKLVSTMPLPHLVSILEDAPPVIRTMGRKLKFKPLFYLNVVLKKTVPRPKFHWCYLPSPEVPFYRVGVYTNFSKECAPAGVSTLYIELSSRQRPDIKKCLPRVARYLIEMGVISRDSDIQSATVNLIDCAYVIYDKNYEIIVPKIHDFLRAHNIYSIGRYGKWEYSSMEDALIQGKEIARLL